MQRIYPEAGPDTDNVKYGVETILMRHLKPQAMTRHIIDELAQYVVLVGTYLLATRESDGIFPDPEVEVDVAALFVNTSIEGT